MKGSAKAEEGELAAGLENERESIPIGPPPEVAHPIKEAQHVVERTMMDVFSNKGVPVENGGGRGRDPLQRGESVGGGIGDVQVGGDEMG